MGRVSETELSKILYLEPSAVRGRLLLMMPFWDGAEWHMWVEGPQNSIIKLQIADAAHANYIAKLPACETDINIWFIEHIWQRANWPEVSRTNFGIQNDFHLLATSVAKLDHFFHAREKVGQDLISSFVQTELEYLITVARSVFDLLQEALAAIWNGRIKLLDPTQDAIKKQHKLPDKFTKMAIHERKTPRPAEELVERYAITPILAEQYNRIAPFYLSLLKARDRIIHGGASVETVFMTEKGFCVGPNTRTFSDFEWKPEHYYNENLVSLLPWVAHVVTGTIQACNDLTRSFASGVEMPPEIAPGYRVFIRDPANLALIQLLNTANGNVVWWSDTV